MAHELDFSNNRANIAYVGETPWHGLGSKLEEGQSSDIWLKEAGLDWTAKKAKVAFDCEDGEHHTTDSEVVYRSDTKKLLGVVSDRYKIVQPKEVIEFYSDVVATRGWNIEVAGALDEGKRIWALAKTDGQIAVGNSFDVLNTYLLLSTSFDGTSATVGKFTSVRVVCQNTLTLAFGEKNKATVSVPHSRQFNADAVKSELGIYEAATLEFKEKANSLTKATISDKDAAIFIAKCLGVTKEEDKVSTRLNNIIKDVYLLYKGNGKGSTWNGSSGTLWGAVNAITEYTDHHINSRSANNRLRSAWFGKGEQDKLDAFSLALGVVAGTEKLALAA